ncbi:hypothetical protein [Halobellus rarus]|uniref:Uncharacterized protein n=1 Tax=Halobellus rarus TaxID=1126237 RepID=A0ABD6CJ43_9EURY|nr:hypothetical protein [Halobellus rarus]
MSRRPGFKILNLVAKVGFGIILLSSREVLDAAGSVSPDPEPTD